MAARGKRAEPAEVHAARGTRRAGRPVPVAIVSSSSVLGMQPPELPADVAQVWADYVGAAIVHGARQCDADSFAEWCTMTANLRKARTAEEAAPASYIQQWRQLGELFGLCGPKSRLLPKAGGDQPSNPFLRHGPTKR